RNFIALQSTLPQFQWVPPSAVAKYRGISPAKFGVNTGAIPGTVFPLYTLFDPAQPAAAPTNTVVAASKTAFVDGSNITVNWLAAVPSGNISTTTSSTSTTTPSTQSAAGTVAPQSSTTANSQAANVSATPNIAVSAPSTTGTAVSTPSTTGTAAPTTSTT